MPPPDDRAVFDSNTSVIDAVYDSSDEEEGR